MRDYIKLEAEIDLRQKPAETRVKRIDGVWQDWGYFLEVCGFMAYQVMVKNRWSKEKTANYAKKYILKCLGGDYKIGEPIVKK